MSQPQASPKLPSRPPRSVSFDVRTLTTRYPPIHDDTFADLIAKLDKIP